jgi:citrate synthase
MPLYNNEHYGKCVEYDDRRIYVHGDNGMIVINWRTINDVNETIHFLLTWNHLLDGNAFGLRKHCGPILGVDMI